MAWSSGTETVPQATVLPSISKGARGRGQGAAFTGRKMPVTIVPGDLTETDIEDLA